MHITVQGHPAETLAADLLVIPVSAGTKAFRGAAATVDKASGRLLSDLVEQQGFTGKEGERAIIRTDGRLPSGKVLLIGAGEGKLDAAALRKLAARVTRTARHERAKIVAILLDVDASNARAAAQASTEGALLGDYRFLKYRDADLKSYAELAIDEVRLVLKNDRKTQAEAMKGVRRGEISARGTVFARGLVNEPASEMTPTRLTEIAMAVAKGRPDRLSVKIIDEKGLKAMKAGGILAIAKGSDEPPFMVHLIYKPKKKSKKRVVFVGKGITFDSGGLSLKPAKSMEDMKIDMAGAAAVMGVFSVIADLAPDVEVHGITALCENMPSGKAVRPGDIVRSMNGKTIEILNTDAEGRVTLADALHYGVQLEPDALVDMATLTGACMVALGQEVAGLMGTSDKLAAGLLKAAESSGELMSRLPLPKEYVPLIRSTVADLKNVSSSPYGGAITAGLFLKEFVGDTPWCHIDVAGPAWAETDAVPHQPKGATGFGVRTMLHFVENL